MGWHFVSPSSSQKGERREKKKTKRETQSWKEEIRIKRHRRAGERKMTNG